VTERRLTAALGNRIRSLVARTIQPQVAPLRRDIFDTGERLRALDAHVQAITDRLDRVLALAGAHRDGIPQLRDRLATVRETPEYASLWTEREPLISVRMATWNRADMLVDVAVASVLRQSYQRFELVIVGDGCTDDTEARLRKVGDDRIRFHNLPTHTVYPEDPRRRWMVMGSVPRNVADRMSRGMWLAPLDDDDEFTDDHLELLLTSALEHRNEFVYGLIDCHWTDISLTDRVGSYPPESGSVGLQASLYPRLLDFFTLDPVSWALDETCDWTVVRRMIDAGVRIGFVDRLVTRMTTERRYPDAAHDHLVEPPEPR
jgi:hypothetical protein